MTPGAAAALFLLLAGEDPSYPLGPLRFPSLTTPGHPFVLTDLRYGVRAQESTAQTLEARLRVGTWGFLGVEFVGERRELSLATQRLNLLFAANQDRYDAQARFRASRFLLQTTATRRTPAQGKGWLLDGQAVVRLNPNLEALGGYFEDTDTSPRRALRTRVLRQGFFGFLYQHDASWDLSARNTRARVRTEAGPEQDLNRWNANGNGLLAGVEWDAEVSYERTDGPFRRREGFVDLGASTPLGGHWLPEVRYSTNWEPGVLRFERELSAGLTFFGRRIRLGRAGEAARRTVELARRACELGYNERRAHDENGRRALRERLALSPRREELREAIDALYQAEVAERNVPQAGFEVSDGSDRVRGTKTRTYHGFLGVPWRPAWPFHRSEEAVPFLRADYVRSEQRFESGFATVTQELSLEAELNREMSVVLRWSRSDQGPLAVAREVARTRTIELEYVYAFGR